MKIQFKLMAIVALIGLIALCGCGNPAGDFKIIAYARTWALGSTQEEFNRGLHWKASDIRGDMLTSLDVSFATIFNKTSIQFVDMSSGGTIPGFVNLLEEVTELGKKYPNLSINVAIGGWGAPGFPEAAATVESRREFASNVAAFVKKFNFRGVDIDWEYPENANEGGNLYLMLSELRNALDSLGESTGRHYNLTVAVPASANFLNIISITNIAKVVDAIKVMCYDYYGSWTVTTGHLSALFTNPDDPQGISDQTAIDAYLAAGAPAKKLILGIPFYGRAWDGVPAGPNAALPGLYQPYSAVLWNDGLAYADIIAKIGKDGFTRYWDPVSKVPYLYNGTIFITYDDPESIKAKVEYAKTMGLGGVMYWEYGHDMRSELLAALKKAVDTPFTPPAQTSSASSSSKSAEKQPDRVPLDDKYNPALAANGATVETDSVYAGYNHERLNDGTLNDKTLTWAQSGWASADKADDHFAIITFAKPTAIKKITIYWCFDNGAYKSSMNYLVQYWNGADWVTIKEEKNGKQNLSHVEILLPEPVTTAKIRYFQPAGGGLKNRPNIAWIGEITVTDAAAP